jgi:3-oxocholest-4-en-26-oate---CoA ligase
VILAETRHRLAHYKIPKELRVVARVPRAPNGKPDYASAKKLFETTAR